MPLDFFKPDEFKRCIPSCSLSDMDENFMRRLNLARFIAGVAFVLSCAFRSSAWDISRGRSGTGYHTQGRAVDVLCSDSSVRSKIVLACLIVGLSCGIASTFIHIDDRPNQIVFLY